MAQNLPRGTPARVLVLLTLLTGLVTVSVWRDALQRPGNTWVRYPTALGDTGFLLPGQLPTTLVTEGGPVSLTAGGTPLRRRDDRMFRVRTGMEAMLPFALFTTGEDLAANPDPKLYARTAPHAYMRLRAVLANPAQALPPSTPPPRPLDGSLAGKSDVTLAGKPDIPPVPNAGGAAGTSAMVETAPAAGPVTPPQVPPGEDPDKMLALPAAPVSERPGPVVSSPASPESTPVPPPPGNAPGSTVPKAVPLPPEEQDSPVEGPVRPTL